MVGNNLRATQGGGGGVIMPVKAPELDRSELAIYLIATFAMGFTAGMFTAYFLMQ